jgi:hypothetical protein
MCPSASGPRKPWPANRPLEGAVIRDGAEALGAGEEAALLDGGGSEGAAALPYGAGAAAEAGVASEGREEAARTHPQSESWRRARW